MISITINNKPIMVEEGTTILEAAKKLNILIPTLCHLNLHDINVNSETASCRVCMVENTKNGKLIPACATRVWEGLDVRTDTLKVIRTRRIMIELLLSDHPKDCLVCAKSGHCELQNLANENNIRSVRFNGKQHNCKIDDTSLSLVRDMNKCILCKRCETMCNDIQTVGVLTDVGRGFDTVVGTAFDHPMHETVCTFCGQCVSVCPTGALTEVDNTSQVWNALDSEKTVIVQVAPAVRVALGEEFGMEAGSIITGKMVSALKALGFDYVFDTNFAADVTVMEEASEFIDRFKNGGTLPILTSCCPSWIKFVEHNFGDLVDIPSSCKSPHEMFGALAKTYFAEKIGKNPKDIIVVSVMPCVAKKYESARPELSNQQIGTSDVDIVISTRELARMISEATLDFTSLPDSEFDRFMGQSTGAAAIFGATGGVAEASLRTAYDLITGESLQDVNFTPLRGFENIKEATVNINGTNINIAVASGLGNARKLLEMVRNGEKEYHLIEIMACPGGCIDGGGQPYIRGDIDILNKRMNAIYQIDSDKKIRKAHENPELQQLYKEFLGEPYYGQKAHDLLHTHFHARKKYDEA
ncbi:MAG: NADH-dependent [FeFe] hydrogenase, group A6 [Eubacteriales bacterium]|nr:NADH-dependent [FeFe] hydrogenase, group A6 [Eubacteriales bacterium]MDY3333190.1 NADH-dependent [FeFe] hydrogenase, group A6 [Gallibacter sp.]